MINSTWIWRKLEPAWIADKTYTQYSTAQRLARLQTWTSAGGHWSRAHIVWARITLGLRNSYKMWLICLIRRPIQHLNPNSKQKSRPQSKAKDQNRPLTAFAYRSRTQISPQSQVWMIAKKATFSSLCLIRLGILPLRCLLRTKWRV